MTFAATLHRRSATFIVAVVAAAAVFVPFQSAARQHVIPASLTPRASLPVAGPAHVDPALNGVTGSVRVIIQTTDAQVAEVAVARAGGTVTRLLPIARAIAATIPSSAIHSLARVASVRTISLDARVHVLGSPDPSKVKS
ncbi:MAG TPA: hypothetical protein VJ818_09240, partial [Actinomycetota bacterium]|nr:hypothetical protein [Actinomycetota bacterium]